MAILESTEHFHLSAAAQKAVEFLQQDKVQ
jgi:hypothetical protein